MDVGLVVVVLQPSPNCKEMGGYKWNAKDVLPWDAKDVGM